MFYGLAKNTRRSYDSAVRMYEKWCAEHQKKPWPMTKSVVQAWVVARLCENGKKAYMSRVKPAIMERYIVALRSYHIDRNEDAVVLRDPSLMRLLDGAKYIYAEAKEKRNPITKTILQDITSFAVTTVKDYNIDAAFKLAFAACLRLGEITYTKTDLQMDFTASKTTRSDIRFADDHFVLRLKRSKTDTNHEGVDIIVAKTGERICAYTALQRLYTHDPQPPDAPLFSLGTSFDRNSVIRILRARLKDTNHPEACISGHSFRKGAAQHAHDCGMPQGHIMQLGRWTLDAVKAYYTTSTAERFRRSLAFQTGTPPAFSSQMKESSLH